MNMENNVVDELRRRRRAAWSAIGSIVEVTDQLKDPDTRAKLFNSTVLPALCYATETWTDTQATTRTLRTTHRALERRLLKISRREQWTTGQSSEALRRLSMLRDPIEYTRRAKHRWAGHVMRYPDDRWTIRTTIWYPYDKKRGQGRPPTKWADAFQDCTKEYNKRLLPYRVKPRHWMQLARDRGDWRRCDPHGNNAQ